jgi:adenylate cyclase
MSSESAAPAASREPAPLPSKREIFGERIKTTATRFCVLASCMSIRYKIAGALVAVLCLAIASLGMITFGQQKKVLTEEMQKRAEVILHQIAGAGKTGLLTKDELHTYSTIKELQQSGGILYAMVLDNRGAVFVHNILAEKGKELSSPADKAALEAKDMLIQETSFAGDPVLDASLPIVSKLGEKTLRIGTARVGLPLKSLHQTIRHEKLVFAGITCAFVLLGLAISFALGKVLTRQIMILAAGMEVVAKGDLSRQVRIEARDEIGRLAETFNEMIGKLQEKLHMEKYLSSSTLKVIRQRPGLDGQKLGGERRHVGVLFSDVRGFTSMSEKLEPEEVVGLLNIYLNLQAEVVYQYGGSVDKFVGDEVMAIFTDKDSELQAARAALEIQRYVRALNEARERLGKRAIAVGVGINCGEVVMGNMGSERQMDYTVIGDPINVAARLCGAAAAGQIILSQAVAEALGPEAKTNALGPIQLKGKKAALDVWELLDLPGACRMHMRKRATLQVDYRLAGLSEEKHPATVMDIGREGCVFRTSAPSGVGTNLELDIALDAVPGLDKVDAVVRHVRKADGSYLLGVQFQKMDMEVQDKLTEWVHQV